MVLTAFKERYFGGWRDGKAGRVLLLHTADPGFYLISGTPFDPLSFIGSGSCVLAEPGISLEHS